MALERRACLQSEIRIYFYRHVLRRTNRVGSLERLVREIGRADRGVSSRFCGYSLSCSCGGFACGSRKAWRAASCSANTRCTEHEYHHKIELGGQHAGVGVSPLNSSPVSFWWSRQRGRGALHLLLS